MTKFSERPILLSFEEKNSHTVVFDPAVEIEMQQGRSGPYEAIPVEESGQVALLPLGSTRLQRKLKALGPGRKTVTITLKKGATSFENDYEVKVVK